MHNNKNSIKKILALLLIIMHAQAITAQEQKESEIANIEISHEFFYSVATGFFIYPSDQEPSCSHESTALIHTCIMWLLTGNFAQKGSFELQYKNKKIVFSKGMIKTFVCALVQLYAHAACKNSSSPIIQNLGGCMASTVVRLVFELLPKKMCFNISSYGYKKRQII